MFLPANTTAICQPMDQAVIETLKRKYRRKILSSLVEAIDDRFDMIEKLKEINLKDVAFCEAQAWENVGATTIARSWKALLNEDETADDSIEETDSTDESIENLLHRIPGCEDVMTEDVNQWMVFDEVCEQTDKDIVKIVNDQDGKPDEAMNTNEEIMKVAHNERLKITEAALTNVH